MLKSEDHVHDGPYWAIDIPGLTEPQAALLAAHIADGPMGLSASLVDPAQFLTLHLNRESVEAISSALACIGTNDIVLGLREILDDWLVSTESTN